MAETREIQQPCAHCSGDGYTTELNGAYLRGLREDARISLRALARKVKLSPAYLSDIERGRRWARPSFLRIEYAIQHWKGARQ